MAEEIKHDWQYINRLGITCCQRCGIVLQRGGANKDKPCKGIVRVQLREGNKDGDK